MTATEEIPYGSPVREGVVSTLDKMQGIARRPHQVSHDRYYTVGEIISLATDGGIMSSEGWVMLKDERVVV